jgi:hypothetical protein
VDRGAWIALVLMAVLTACSGQGQDEQAGSTSAIAVAGRWQLPADVAAEGAKVRLHYDEAPLWTGASACSGKLRVGPRKLGTWLAAKFAQISSIGGYACRRNTADGARMSVHGTGRAMDVFIPPIGGQADNGKGDVVANWLVDHAAEIGVQLIIWDRSVWRGNGTNAAAYGGPNPHADHIHVELTLTASAAATPWFADMGDAGDADPDAALDTDMDADTDAAGDTDAGADMEAGPDPDFDASDPGTDVDASAPSADVDAAQQDDDAGAGWEIQEGEDSPGDPDSVLKTRPTSKGSGASYEADSLASSGCSTTPLRDSSDGAGVLLVAAALIAARTRRRRA